MPSLSHLPLELLVAILKNLNPFDLLSVAKTFNKCLFREANRLLKPHQAWVRNAQAMTALFSPKTTHSTRRICPSYPGHIAPFGDDCVSHREEIARKNYKDLSLDPRRGPYIRCSPPDLISWMKLDGEFEWLEPLDEHMTDTMEVYNGVEGDRPMAEKAQVDILVKHATELGLELPPGFETFLRSDRLHHRFPSYSAWYFELSKIIPCPASVDDGQGGYLCRFHFDQQCCAFAYLYLNSSGNHCVVVSQTDVYACLRENAAIVEPNAEGDGGRDTQWSDDEEDDMHEGELEKENFSIAGLTFEEYLVTVYYEGLLSFQAKPFDGLKSFVQHVYRSPFEVESMRESSKSSPFKITTI